EKRTRRIVSESLPVLEDVNGGKLARERNYNAQPLEPALGELSQSRATSVERLRSCQEVDLERTAEMQGSGVVTLRRLLEMWMRHDSEHLADMVELRRAVEAGDPHVSFGEHEAA
ncbi:MAG TPA: DinB family protein, partial [Terriglobales bacterium]|nr:DinB family protein [Terriglobales bacterium]